MRTSHATPEFCPPPAASADLARRRLLTAVAAAPVIAVTPTFAEGFSNEDDAPLFEMSRQIAALESAIKKLCDEAEARHALYDKKEGTYDKAKAELGIDKIEDRQAELWDKISNIIDNVAAYQPKTIAGVVEKMRIFKKERAEIFSLPPEQLYASDKIFLSALADLERLASVRAS